MYKGKKVVVVSPVGREASMRIMFPAVKKHQGIVDEHHLWVNTNVESDLDFIQKYEDQNPEFVHLKYDGGAEEIVPEWRTRASNVKWFYNYCVEPDTFYFKVDDDVIFIEDGTYEKLIDYKLENPDIFLAYPLSINNMWSTHFMREHGVLNIPFSECLGKRWYNEYQKVLDQLKNLEQTLSLDYNEPLIAKYIPEHSILCPEYWGNPYFAEGLHNLFLDLYFDGKIDELKIPDVVLKSHEPATINFVCWSGEDFAEFDGNVRCTEDESWLSMFYPVRSGKYNAMIGSAIVSHYSYYIQREYLNQTDVLNRYAKIYEV